MIRRSYRIRAMRVVFGIAWLGCAVVAEAAVPKPSVTLSVKPGTIVQGQTAMLSWSASNATTCNASGGWSGSQLTSGTRTVSPLAIGSTRFYLSCTGAGGTVRKSVQLRVNRPPAPVVSISVSPAAIVQGSSATLTWSATNATTCTASGAWSGAMPSNGAMNVSPGVGTAKFSLSCSGGGGTGTKSVSLTVNPPPKPLVTVTIVPSAINAGTTATLSWSVTNATNCTASGAWTGTKTPYGSMTVGPLSAGTFSYILACTNVTGTTQSMASLTVKGGVVNGLPPSSSATYALIAWNDLGMHCIDGKDYSVFSILPPYNNLHAQLVSTATGKQVDAGVTLTYESVADVTGSFNTLSSNKVNFWDYVQPLYGASPPRDVGLAGCPMSSTQPSPLTYNAQNKWFEAVGIPITPFDDALQKNYYPMVQVIAKDSSGATLATAKVVLPVSDEMTCIGCHASRSGGNAAQTAAMPIAGWVDASDPEKDWKLNILRLHDEKQQNDAKFHEALAAKSFDPSGLYATVSAGTPVLCAACHASNALPGTGYGGISTMTSALHLKHGPVIDPTNGVSLNNLNNRNSCYQCHPGSATQCLRGVMGAAKDANGNLLLHCQSCHGNLAQVGDPKRTGWLEEPNCQACHHDSQREVSVFEPMGKLRIPTDQRFATSPDTPAAGFSLYRFSTGHGGLQCESCHGATHAEYPSAEANDNILAMGLQGHAGTIAECTVCHNPVPFTPNGGPHGMHSTTDKWVSSHGDHVEQNGSGVCAYCHGADYRGTALSTVKTDKTFSAEGRNYSFHTGQAVGCFDCHNGPHPD